MKPLFIEASSPKGKNEVSTIQEDVIKSYEDSPQILISLNKESFNVGPFTMTFFSSFFSLIAARENPNTPSFRRKYLPQPQLRGAEAYGSTDTGAYPVVWAADTPLNSQRSGTHVRT